jgi:hypothetical protein
MPSDKKTVYTDLVDASTSVIDQLFEDTRIVEIGQDNWYPDLLFRQDTLFVHETAADATIQVSTKAKADIKETRGSKERYFKHITDARSILEDSLNEEDFVTEPYADPDRGQGRLRVYGWDRDPMWFQTGDYMKTYRWRTPVEVVHACPPGERPPEDRPLPVTGDDTYIGADSHHLYLRGNRGGEYLIDYDDDVGSLYQRNTQMSETLEKMVEVSRTIFVGNPKTGPRLDISSDGTEE